MTKRLLAYALFAAALCLFAAPAFAENCNPQASAQQPTTAPQTQIVCNQMGQLAPDGWTFTGSATASGVIPFTSPGATNGIIDTTGYGSVYIQPTSVGSGNTIQIQASNDGANWVTAAGCLSGVNAIPISTLTVTTAIYPCPVVSRYVRINITVYGSGTVAVSVVLKLNPLPVFMASVSQGNSGQNFNWNMLVKGTTTGGLTNFRVNAAASTNATNIKASAGQVYGWCLTNAAASLRYVRLFNKASAPTVGTDTPTQTIALAASGGQVCQTTDIGIVYAAGIGYDITGANGDSDATAVTANDVTGAIFYQ